MHLSFTNLHQQEDHGSSKEQTCNPYPYRTCPGIQPSEDEEHVSSILKHP